MLNFYRSFFYINICGFIGRGKFLYETQVLNSSYLRHKVQLPTSDSSTKITAGGIKVRLQGPVPLERPLAENTSVLNASSSSRFRNIMWSQNYIRGPCSTWTPLAEKNYTKSTISQYLIVFLISAFYL